MDFEFVFSINDAHVQKIIMIMTMTITTTMMVVVVVVVTLMMMIAVRRRIRILYLPTCHLGAESSFKRERQND